MMPTLVSSYDQFYGSSANHYRHRRWMQKPFIKALVRKAALAQDSRVLDIGCGQGFFSGLLGECGLRVTGADLSAQGIACARAAKLRADFTVGNPLDVQENEGRYDAVFCRALSLYNREDFAANSSVTDSLLKLLKPGGKLLWLYTSHLNPAEGQSWRQHSLAEAQAHFKKYGAEVWFCLRPEARVLGKWTFTKANTGFSQWASKRSGLGGELVAIIQKPWKI